MSSGIKWSKFRINGTVVSPVSPVAQDSLQRAAEVMTRREALDHEFELLRLAAMRYADMVDRECDRLSKVAADLSAEEFNRQREHLRSMFKGAVFFLDDECTVEVNGVAVVE